MVWLAVLHLSAFFVDLAVGARRAEGAKGLESALLRHQVRLLQRRSPHPTRQARRVRPTGAVLAAKLSSLTVCSRQHLSRAVLLVQPETVLRWHRDLVRRK